MPDDEMARKAPDTSFEIAIANGVAKGGLVPSGRIVSSTTPWPRCLPG